MSSNSLKIYKSVLSLSQCSSRGFQAYLTRRDMSCRKSWPPNDPCKPGDCKSGPCNDKSAPPASRPCSATDPCRPPNLCNPGESSVKSPKYWIDSLDPEKRMQSFDNSGKPSCCESKSASGSSSYPHQPWPTYTRATTWTPSTYMSPPCGVSGTCKHDPCAKPVNFSSSCEPLSSSR